MNAQALIDPTLTALAATDTAKQALHYLHKHAQSALPVCEKQVFLGFVSTQTLHQLPDHTQLSKHTHSTSCWVSSTAHEYEVLSTSRAHQGHAVAVLKPNHRYLGCISVQHMIARMDLFTSLESRGAILSVRVGSRDYVLRQVVDIIESCGIKILQLCLAPSTASVLQVMIKLSTENTQEVCHALQRHGYEVVGYEMEESADVVDRYNFLVKYLDI